MKIRSYAPILLAAAGLFGVYHFVHKDEAPKPTAAQVETKSVSAPAAPAAPALPVAAQPLPPPPQPQLPGVAPTTTPHMMDPEEAKAHEPKAKLPKLTESEKVVAAKEHITVMDRRIELLEAEIAELDKKGDKAKADEQRVVVKRIKEHADKLKQDIAEGREPE